MMTLIWSSLTIGAVYALVATGYNVVFTASGVFNFAHAQLMMLGVFLAYAGLVVLKWPIIVVFLFAGVVVFFVAALEERIAIRPVRLAEAQLVTTVGVATLINGAAQRIWGPSPLSVPYFASNQTVTVFGGRVLPDEIVIIVTTVVVVILLMLLSKRTMIGLAMLAIAENRESALLRGVNVRRLALGAFAFSGLLAGLLGPIIGPQTFAAAGLASAIALYGFVALAIGGFGSLPGGLIGGFVVGFAEEFTARYMNSNYPDVIVFVILLAVLLLRPNGLFGKARERAV
jgi:branched-chain amino acid transport system permease protein